MSNLSRDVCVYSNGQVIEWIVAYPVPLADGRLGVSYKGLAYPLSEDDDAIDLGDPSHSGLRGRHHIDVTLLPFEILPPGEGVRDFATTLRNSVQYEDGEIDLRRLQVLVDLEHHFAERQSHRYRSSFPSRENDNGYVVLAIETQNKGGEDAVAISPLKGEHATFVVRHRRAKSAWQVVLSKTKVEAVGLGADRLVFKGRAEEGLDAYAAMLDKIIELLEGAPIESVDADHLFGGTGSHLDIRSVNEPEPYEPFGFDWRNYPEDCSRHQEEVQRLEAEKRAQADKKRKRGDRIAMLFMPLMVLASPYSAVAFLFIVLFLLADPGNWMGGLAFSLMVGLACWLGWVFSRRS